MVEVVPYGVSGSPQLLENVVSKLDNRCQSIVSRRGCYAKASDECAEEYLSQRRGISVLMYQFGSDRTSHNTSHAETPQ